MRELMLPTVWIIITIFFDLVYTLFNRELFTNIFQILFLNGISILAFFAIRDEYKNRKIFKEVKSEIRWV